MNKVILCGNLVRDNEIHYSQGGLAILNNVIAINEKKKNANGEYQTVSTFIDLVFFGKTAEVVNQYLKKGSKLLVEGKIDVSHYQTKEGENRKSVKIIVEQLEMIGEAQSSSKAKPRLKSDNLGYQTLDFNDKGDKYDTSENSANGETIPF